MAWLREPKTCWGSSGGQPEGQREAKGRGGASHCGSRTVLPTGWGQGSIRHRMSLLAAGQCAHGARDRWLGCHHFVLLLGRGQTLVWVHCGGQKGEKASLQGTGGLSLEECAGVRLGLTSAALWDGTWLSWLYGTAVSPCSSREPLLLLSRGAEDAPAHQGQGESWGPPVPCLIPVASPTGNILHRSRDGP